MEIKKKYRDTQNKQNITICCSYMEIRRDGKESNKQSYNTQHNNHDMVANLQFVAEGFGQWTSTLLYIF
jgi:hypothetical protein